MSITPKVASCCLLSPKPSLPVSSYTLYSVFWQLLLLDIHFLESHRNGNIQYVCVPPLSPLWLPSTLDSSMLLHVSVVHFFIVVQIHHRLLIHSNVCEWTFEMFSVFGYFESSHRETWVQVFPQTYAFICLEMGLAIFFSLKDQIVNISGFMGTVVPEPLLLFPFSRVPLCYLLSGF